METPKIGIEIRLEMEPVLKLPCTILVINSSQQPELLCVFRLISDTIVPIFTNRKKEYIGNL